ncbi:MAG: class I SAM-dependent methyltransferase [Candidatus Woesearchaeota archaeon]
MDFKKINKETYDKIANNWNKKRRYNWNAVTNFLKSFDNKSNLKLLDLGCGTGRHLENAHSLGFKKGNILGVDFSDSQLKVTKNKGFNVKKSRIESIDIMGNTYDIILCIAAIHHLTDKNDQVSCLKEIKRILKKDGSVLISFWKPSDEYIEKNIEKNKFDFINEKVANVTYTYKDKKHPRYYYFFDVSEFKELVKEVELNVKNDFSEGSNYYFELTM